MSDDFPVFIIAFIVIGVVVVLAGPIALGITLCVCRARARQRELAMSTRPVVYPQPVPTTYTTYTAYPAQPGSVAVYPATTNALYTPGHQVLMPVQQAQPYYPTYAPPSSQPIVAVVI